MAGGQIRRIRLLISLLVISIVLLSNLIMPKAICANSTEPYINLYGQRTDVMVGDEIILTLSVVNTITSPGDLVVQLTLSIPPGWSVASTEFSAGVGGLSTAVYKVKKGAQQNINLHLLANEPYQGQIKGYLDYYIDGNEAKHVESNLPVIAKKEAIGQDLRSGTTGDSGKGTPWVIVGVVLGIVSVAAYVTRKSLARSG